MAEDASSPWAFVRDYDVILAKPAPRRGSLQTRFRSLDVVAPHAYSPSTHQPSWPLAREFCAVDDLTEVVWGDFHADEVMPCRLQLTLDQHHTTAGSNPTWLLFELLMPVPLEHRTDHFRQSRDEALTLAVELRGDKACGVAWVPFRAACVDVVLSGLKLSPTLKDALTDVATTPGVKLRDVDFYSGKQLPRQQFGEIVELLTLPRGSDDEYEHEADASLCFSHRLDQLSVIELTHFLSAIQQGQRFQSVNLERVMEEMSVEDRRFVWFWILHTFFSSTDANRSIQSLELSFDELRKPDIATVRLYTEARNPAALMCHPRWRLTDAYDAETSPPKRVALEKSVTVFLSPSRTRRAESMALASAGWFNVIQENGAVVDVIVPAYGQCRVSKDDVAKWDVLPLQSLLELVGRPLESLDVEIKLPRTDTFLDRVWPACPNLKSMQIGPTRLRSLQYFIDAYETNKCSVPSLALRQCTLGDEGSRMSLIEAFEGNVATTKIASTLQEFSFSENPDGYAFLSLDELRVIAEKLATNQLLRYVALGIVANEIECYIDPMFEPLKGLSDRSKYALLSFVDHAKKPELSAGSVQAARPLAQLDSSILLHIFKFAANSVKRSIALKYDFRRG